MHSTKDATAEVRSERPSVAVCSLNYAPELTGIGPYSAELAGYLNDNEVKCSVYTTFPHYPEWRFQSRPRKATERSKFGVGTITRLLHVLPFRGSWLTRILSEVSFGLRLAMCVSEIRRFDSVVVVSPALISSWILLKALHLSKYEGKSVLWIQDLYGRAAESGVAISSKLSKIVSLVERDLINSADRVVTIHSVFADILSVSYGRDTDVTVVRSWARVEEPLGSDLDTRSVRAAFGVPDDCLFVVHAGNMGRKQALRNVVDCARLADNECQKVFILLLGDGVERSYLEREANGIDRISVVDSVDAATFPAVLQAADILLVNERSGLGDMAVPSKLTAYFGAGRPVVAAVDADGVVARELASAGAGFVVEPDDPEALLRGLLSLGSDVKLRATYGANGKRFSNDNLERSACLSSLLEVVSI